MKILFTGGGSGGHFYPIIAIAEELRGILDEENIVGVKMYYMAPTPYDKDTLFENDLIYKGVPSGKRREYFSLLNYIDYVKVFVGVLFAVWKVFWIFPDVVVSKGGFGSVPALFAARLFGIPIIIHESDTRPGTANRWASKFAERIAVSYPNAGDHFPKEVRSKIAYTGQPVRRGIRYPAKEGAAQYLNLDETTPTILILGGSQGAQPINEVVLEALPRLVEKYQVIHQVGSRSIDEVRETASVILGGNKNENRYKPFEYLGDLAMRMSAGISQVVVTRAGSSLFEIAAWGRPAIIIPITNSRNNHQRHNAYTYARSGGAVVLEETNVNTSILVSEIDRIITNENLAQDMGKAGQDDFFKEDAAAIIAKGALDIAMSHIS